MIEGRTKVLGGCHTDTLAAEQNFGALLAKSGDLEEVLALILCMI